MFSIAVQEGDFDVGAEYQALIADDQQGGAVVFFVGRVRDMNLDHSVRALTLEHYPGMTEKSLEAIMSEARQRWQLVSARIVHRVGHLSLGDQIVYVGVTSSHREQAFAAAEFMMDFLKTRAPFWKKEERAEGEEWLRENPKDQRAFERWKHQ